jgi:hypothetical protein
MKTQVKLLIYSILFITIFSSCEEVIEVDLDEGQTLLVVDGWLTDLSSIQTIKLTTTAPYFNNAPTPRLKGATVLVKDNEGNEFPFAEVEDGVYRTDALMPKVGNTYYLSVLVNGDEFTSEGTITPIPPIDSLTYNERTENIETDEDKDKIEVYHNGPEFPTTGDYFRVKVYKNGKFLNEPDDLIFATDEFVNGNYIGELLLNDNFKVDEDIRVEILSISKDAFHFFDEMSRQINNGGMFANPPANIRTNIVSSNPNKKAIGFFGVSSVSFMEGKIEGKEGSIK